MGKVLIMHDQDNVGMVLQDSKVGDTLTLVLDGQAKGEITLRDDIDIYHKTALVDIVKDQEIIKYGELIGLADTDIQAGKHVHVFNIRSVKV